MGRSSQQNRVGFLSFFQVESVVWIGSGAACRRGDSGDGALWCAGRSESWFVAHPGRAGGLRAFHDCLPGIWGIQGL